VLKAPPEVIHHKVKLARGDHPGGEGDLDRRSGPQSGTRQPLSYNCAAGYAEPPVTELCELR